jgi:hypothetical protein
LLAAAGVVLFYRWTLHLSTPRNDYRQARDFAETAAITLRRGCAMIRVWLISLVRYVPTAQVRDSWVILRDRLADGRYGPAGT